MGMLRIVTISKFIARLPAHEVLIKVTISKFRARLPAHWSVKYGNY